jgi:hypothetical protein
LLADFSVFASAREQQKLADQSVTRSTDKPVTRSPAAERMRRHRERRKKKLRCLTILIREREIDELTHKGLLRADARNDPLSVTMALYEFFERTLKPTT